MAILKAGEDDYVNRSIEKESGKYTIIIQSSGIRNNIYTYASYLEETLDSEISDNAHNIAAQLLARYKKISANPLTDKVATASVTTGLFIARGDKGKIKEPLSYLTGGVDQELINILQKAYHPTPVVGE